ncbi:hypothetical protein GCM10010277_01960 [Streptomyces longisporoflavus]|nr:hypothetical protein GCM10010277_01960 [Streptomyces longisporoflavus]
MRGDTLQDAAREHVVQRQCLQMHVADVAVADGQGTGAGLQGLPVRAVVQVAQFATDEVAAADRALAVDRDDGLTRAAGQPCGAVRVAAVGEQGVEIGPPGGLVVGVRVALRGVHPQVDPGR